MNTRTKTAAEQTDATDVVAPAEQAPARTKRVIFQRPAGNQDLGTMLGLKSRMSSGTGPSEPHVYWGERHGRQVLIRLGADEKLEGGMLTTNRRLIEVTLVRAQFPPFALVGDGGRVEPADGTGPLPGGVAAAIVSLEPAPDVWRRLQIVAGPEGIVAQRPQFDDFVSGWIYDLWLLERLATAAGALALDRKRIGPAFKVPYGMGRAR